jgi:hypothetical protein
MPSMLLNLIAVASAVAAPALAAWGCCCPFCG